MTKEKLKPLLCDISVVLTILCLSASVLATTPVTAANNSITQDRAIQNGSLITTKNSSDVYIVKHIGRKKYRRLILNPAILNSYANLRWNNVVTVSESTLRQYTISHFIKVQGSNTIYELRASQHADTGVKHRVNLTPSQFVQAGFDLDSIFTVNRVEGSSQFYRTGADRTIAYYPKFRLTQPSVRPTAGRSISNVIISPISKSITSTTRPTSLPKPPSQTSRQAVRVANTGSSAKILPNAVRTVTQPTIAHPKNNTSIIITIQPAERIKNRITQPAQKTTSNSITLPTPTPKPTPTVSSVKTTTSSTKKRSVAFHSPFQFVRSVRLPAQQPTPQFFVQPTPAPVQKSAPAPQPVVQKQPVATPAAYNGSRFISQQALLSEVRKYSWDSNMAYRIAVCESSRNVYALNNTPGREYSVGLFQINLRAHPHLQEQSLYNPVENVRQAYNIYQNAGWRAWSNCYRKVTA